MQGLRTGPRGPGSPEPGSCLCPPVRGEGPCGPDAVPGGRPGLPAVCNASWPRVKPSPRASQLMPPPRPETLRDLGSCRETQKTTRVVWFSVTGIEMGLVSFIYSFVSKNKLREDKPLRREAPVYLKLF